jgi:hypothetical protein
MLLYKAVLTRRLGCGHSALLNTVPLLLQLYDTCKRVHGQNKTRDIKFDEQVVMQHADHF